METYFLVLFLAGQTIEPVTVYQTKEECIVEGKAIVESFKKQHKHSPGWFWCYPGRRS